MAEQRTEFAQYMGYMMGKVEESRARTAYETAYLNHCRIMGEMVNGTVDPEQVLQSVYELEEASLEVIETDHSKDLEKLEDLHSEISITVMTAEGHGYDDLVAQLDERLGAIEGLIATVESERAV
jgi:hypothetical protein